MSVGSTLKRSAEGTNGTLLFLFFFFIHSVGFSFFIQFLSPF